jgi:hypothetical protein
MNADVRSRRAGDDLAGAIFLAIGLQAVSMSADHAARSVEIVRMAGFCALVVAGVAVDDGVQLWAMSWTTNSRQSHGGGAGGSSRRCWAAWLR